MGQFLDALARPGRGTVRAPNAFLTAREFFRHPAGVGTAFPATQRLVEAALDPVDFSHARVVVEFGPGEGPFTRALLARMPQDSRLVTIDVSHRFTRHLQHTIADPRLLAVTGSAASLEAILERAGLGRVDRIVTGIPFSTFAPELAARIMRAGADALSDGGQMIAYQMRDAIRPLLAQRFADIRTSMVWSNIPPCRIYWARHPVRHDGSGIE